MYRVLSLLSDELVYHHAMEEAKHQQILKQMRDLFVMLMCFTDLQVFRTLLGLASDLELVASLPGWRGVEATR